MNHKKWERADAIDGVGTFVEDSYTKRKEKTALKWEMDLEQILAKVVSGRNHLGGFGRG